MCEKSAIPTRSNECKYEAIPMESVLSMPILYHVKSSVNSMQVVVTHVNET